MDASIVLAVVSALSSTSGLAMSGLVYRHIKAFDNLVDLHVRNHPEDRDLLE
jgi:hypothetical protein